MNQKNNPKQDLYRRTYLYALKVIKFVEKLSEDSIAQTIGNQLLRNGTSVSANLIEAKSASSKKKIILTFINMLLNQAMNQNFGLDS
jgi:four helix bundle protein